METADMTKARGMAETEEGHTYELDSVIFEGVPNPSPVVVTFMKRAGGNPVHGGTTNEAVLEMMLARMKYLQSKMPCRENACALTKLEEALMWLNRRTQHRVTQGVETSDKSHKS